MVRTAACEAVSSERRGPGSLWVTRGDSELTLRSLHRGGLRSKSFHGSDRQTTEPDECCAQAFPGSQAQRGLQ